jgi:hypothetical protein
LGAPGTTNGLYIDILASFVLSRRFFNLSRFCSPVFRTRQVLLCDSRFGVFGGFAELTGGHHIFLVPFFMPFFFLGRPFLEPYVPGPWGMGLGRLFEV